VLLYVDVLRKEFGIEYKAEVSNMGTPRDSSMLKLGYGWSGRTTFGELYSFGFVNIHTESPFSEISV